METSKQSIQECIDIIVKFLEDKVKQKNVHLKKQLLVLIWTIYFLIVKGVVKKLEIEEDDYKGRELFANNSDLADLKKKAQGYHNLNINKVFFEKNR